MAVAAMAAGASLVLVGCSGSEVGDEPGTTAATASVPETTVTTAAPTSTTEPPPTSSSPTTAAPTTSSPTTAAPPAPPAPSLVPGQPCAPGSSPDCIDPEGDGSFVYLLGGGECMASPIGGSLCADLDGDGYAGYPDSG
jgi:cell division septation protein DedD